MGDYSPFTLFVLGSPYQNSTINKKGTLNIKGLLRNLVVVGRE